MKPTTIFITLFLILTFMSGIYFCGTHKIPVLYEGIEERNENSDKKDDSDKEGCPDLLIKSGNTILLYNSKMPEKLGINPLPFYNLDEYINYLEIQRRKGIHCPVLFLQEETNTQGKSVYRIRPDIFQPQAGLPTSAPTSVPTTANVSAISVQKYIDANRANPPYNSGNYPGFDPTGLYIGRYTEIDQVHDLTKQAKPLSENPMDGNWGGVLYTKAAVDSGKYKENEVAPPNRQFAEPNTNNNTVSRKNIFA